MIDDLDVTEGARNALQLALTTVIAELGPIRIGEAHQFPFGWRRAGKGRTVWRLVEEAIVQGLEACASRLKLESVVPAASEVGVYDVAVTLTNPKLTCYVNIKAATQGGRAQKDDVSKALSLKTFYTENPNDQLFLATLYMDFLTDDGSLLVALRRSHVLPVAWIPDIYVNPSNNGNLQSSRYRNLGSEIRRTNSEFLQALEIAMAKAAESRSAGMTRRHASG